MTQYLWLCDINHLKREELKENQTGREGGRERKSKTVRAGKEGGAKPKSC